MTRSKQERIELLKQADSYQVTSESLSAGRTTLEVVDAVLAAGVTLIQVREKDWPKKELFHLVAACVKRARKGGALLLVNDHVDVALAAGADGVHLGTGDLPLEAARSIAPDLILGASSHSLDEARAARDAGADYVNIGPVFPTQTKPDAPAWLGPTAVGAIGPQVGIPFTCMGGITAQNLPEVLAAGAQVCAVITAVTKASNMVEAAKSLRKTIQDGRNPLS